jgi:hypothetical protein
VPNYRRLRVLVTRAEKWPFSALHRDLGVKVRETITLRAVA